MFTLKSLLLLALSAATATTAQGTAGIGQVSCGNNNWSKAQIDEALAEGCRLHEDGEQLGNNKYPHRFNNREGLVFTASGPYQEFPIVRNGAYSGGSPGPDRIVFNPNLNGNCVYVGTMTHTGAGGNSFNMCATRSEGRPGAGGDGTPSSVTTATRTQTSTSTATTSTSTSTVSPNSAGLVAQRLGVQGAAVGLMAWAFVL
ncbi:Ribonuclease/ribotoxin [Triangularia verruculosa]|uniref:Ribonuclease/ribotoxin n=1 Tax=Triangularia verruculosa TaxID=2587418 RepID=A0AAN6XPW7_9PEZI|nr:Ribonuclease/ribotoxin [Triangularia verruculosa]